MSLIIDFISQNATVHHKGNLADLDTNMFAACVAELIALTMVITKGS